MIFTAIFHSSLKSCPYVRCKDILLRFCQVSSLSLSHLCTVLDCAVACVSPLMAFISISSCLLILFFLVAATLPDVPSAYLKLPLLRRSPFPPAPTETLSADSLRVSTLYSALHRRHRHYHSKFPITSAASSGSGQYLVTLHLGTPPQRLFLVADTGSDLTWVTCSACRGNCSSRATFFSRRSTTFSPYHCFDSACKLVPHSREHVPCNHTRRHSTCRYEYSYSDGSLTRGFFSRETTTFNSSSGKLVQFQHLSFGCGFNNSGPSVSGPSFSGANGVMGLGRGTISFFSQLGRQFEHKFSYCLMDYTLSPPPTSFLLIGGSRKSGAKKYKLSYTPLLINPLSPTFYYIGIDSVLINNAKLPISPSVWAIDETGNGGTIVDSGTTLTFLGEPAYRIILATVDRLVKLPKSAEPTLGFDLCFNVSNELRPSLPRLSFKFGGGSLLAPPPRNYFIDTAEGVKCLALQPVELTSSFSVIGNLMQQGYTFEFDKDRMRLGYSRRGCAVP